MPVATTLVITIASQAASTLILGYLTYRNLARINGGWDVVVTGLSGFLAVIFALFAALNVITLFGG